MYLIFFTWIKWTELSDYFSVRDLNTSGRNVELIARAFAAMELNLLSFSQVKAKAILTLLNYHSFRVPFVITTTCNNTLSCGMWLFHFTHMWRRWGVPQNFFGMYIMMSLKNNFLLKKLLKWANNKKWISFNWLQWDLNPQPLSYKLTELYVLIVSHTH